MKKLFGYIGYVIINLIAIFFVIGFYNSISGKFQTIIVSLLLIIYLFIKVFFNTWKLQKKKDMLFYKKLFHETNTLINREYDSEEAIKDAEDILDQIKYNKVLFYISGFFDLIVLIIIISTLMFMK